MIWIKYLLNQQKDWEAKIAIVNRALDKTSAHVKAIA